MPAEKWKWKCWKRCSGWVEGESQHLDIQKAAASFSPSANQRNAGLSKETIYWRLFKCVSRADVADSDSDLSNALNLTAYSQVTSQRTQRKRPVVFNPMVLSKTVIQKILGTGSATDFTAAKPGECASGTGCKNTKIKQTSKQTKSCNRVFCRKLKLRLVVNRGLNGKFRITDSSPHWTPW